MIKNFTEVRLRHFSLTEFECKHTHTFPLEGEVSAQLIKTAFAVDLVRSLLGEPIIINSAYRSVLHPLEKDKPSGGGQHTKGTALDIKTSQYSPSQLNVLLFFLGSVGFNAVGTYDNHVHVDRRDRRAKWQG